MAASILAVGLPLHVHLVVDHGQEHCPGFLGVGVVLAVDGRLEVVADVGQFLAVLVGCLGHALGRFDFGWQVLQLLRHALFAALQVGFLGVECTLALFQLLDFALDLDFAQQVYVAGGRRLHFACGQFQVFKCVFDVAANLAGAQLVNHLEFGFLHLPHPHVQCVLGHIGQDLHFKAWEPARAAFNRRQGVALPDDAALALLYIGWLPRHVQMVKRDKALLHVGPSAQLLGGAQQHADLARIYLAEQTGLLLVRVVVVDECDFPLGDALLNQCCFQVVVHRESTLGGLHGSQPVAALGFQFLLRVFGVVNLRLGGFVAQCSAAHQFIAIPSFNAVLERLILGQFLLGCLQGRAKVGEHKLRALHVVVLGVAGEQFLRCAVNAPTGFPLGDRRVHQAHVHGGLAGVGHDDKNIVFALLWWPLALLQRQGTLGDVGHVRFLGGRFAQRHRRALAAFELWQWELAARVFLGECLFHILHRHGVGYLVKHLQ